MKPALRIIFLTIALDLVGFGMVVPLLPFYAQELGASGSQIALLFASYSGMQFIFAPIWGLVSDFYGRRLILLLSIAGNTAAMLLYARADSFSLLLWARVLAGLFAANISVAQAFVADSTTPAERAKGMGLVGAAFGIGFVIGPFLGGELSRWGVAVPAYVAAALGGLNWFWAFWRLPESLPVAQRRRVASRNGLLTAAYGERLQLMRNRLVPPVVLFLIFAQVFGFSMMEVALVLFTKARLGFDSTACGRIFGYSGVILVLMQGGVTHRLTQRYGEKPLVFWGLVLVAVALGLLPLTPWHRPLFLLFGITFIAIGQGLLNPSLNALLSKSAPANAQGTALGLGQSLSSLARVLGPQLGGFAFDWGSENWPFWLGGSVIAIAAWVANVGLNKTMSATS